MKRELGGTWRDMMTAAGEVVDREIDAVVDAMTSGTVPTIQLDSAYERALAKKNLKVERGYDDSDTALTVKLAVIKTSVTTPLPREFLASLG
jgi:hypothetical protein